MYWSMVKTQEDSEDWLGFKLVYYWEEHVFDSSFASICNKIRIVRECMEVMCGLNIVIIFERRVFSITHKPCPASSFWRNWNSGCLCSWWNYTFCRLEGRDVFWEYSQVTLSLNAMYGSGSTKIYWAKESPQSYQRNWVNYRHLCFSWQCVCTNSYSSPHGEELRILSFKYMVSV